eukprot:2015385-Rhodomonas_salina.3
MTLYATSLNARPAMTLDNNTALITHDITEYSMPPWHSNYNTAAHWQVDQRAGLITGFPGTLADRFYANKLWEPPGPQ